MKHLYNSSTVLQTKSKAFLEVNYNRNIYSMTKTGDIIWYKSPEDRVDHPMYIDAAGRNVPVSPETLQPMTNEAGNLVDKNGVLLPRDENGILPHIDDVRVAVTAADIEIKDDKGDDVMVAPDGQIIPTNDNGVPGTVMVEGVPWATDSDGNPVAPLERIFPLRAYKPPVRAENRPVTRGGDPAPKEDDIYPEYFDIEHIVKSERPRRRGVLVAWATPEGHETPSAVGVRGYHGARHYVADENFPYKYWTSPTTSDAVGETTGSDLVVFDNTWRVNNGTSVIYGSNLVSADFAFARYSSNTEYFEKIMNLESGGSYATSFKVAAQGLAHIVVELHEWSDSRGYPTDSRTGSFISKTIIGEKTVPAGTQLDISADITPAEGSVTQVIRVLVKRLNFLTKPKVTLTNMTFKAVVYPIASVAPCALYDRPIDVNKLVVGVDYSLDEMTARDAGTNKPGDYAIRIYKDRGDGVFAWETVSTAPDIDDNGHIVLNYDGTDWGADEPTEDTVPIMGVQLAVFGMKRKDARVNVMEISARRRYDVSDLIMSYDLSSNVSDDSFVLPFGTVNSNRGSLTLSNHDGHFNPNNKFLLNRGGVEPDGSDTFTNDHNPFYQALNGKVDVEIETATFVPGDEDIEYVRVATARSTDRVDAGASMTVDIDFVDDSDMLARTDAPQVFYTGQTMSIIQVLYMLLDTIGFTSVKFSNEDEHFSTHLQYFWTKKDADNVWKVIEDVCRATQTVAFFDEHNILNFKSLKGMYEDALASDPAYVLTTEDLPEVKANISEMELDERVSANKVTVNYRETSEPEKTPSGATPMTVVWEPDGTQILRAGVLTDSLNDKQVGEGSSKFLRLPSGTTKTWPFSGMVNCEGELIKYEGKRYKYYREDGSIATSTMRSEDDRKRMDDRNEFLSHKNTWNGELLITERGCEGTAIKEHGSNTLDSFTRKFYNNGTVTNNYRKGLSIKDSKLHVVGQSTKGAGGGMTTTITTGNINDDAPIHYGTRFSTKSGVQGAGLCIGMSATGEDGLFVQVMTTEATEAQGRHRGELHVWSRVNGAVKYHGFGTDVPISRDQEYDLDVSVRRTSNKTFIHDYSRFYEISLKYGDRGSNVRYLQTALNEHNERLVVDGIFGTATRAAVRRLQKRKSLTQDGIVNEEEWKALEKGFYNANYTTIHATIDGNYSTTVAIPNGEMPGGRAGGWLTGRYGVFTRGRTTVDFEYFYAVRGMEDTDFDESMFYDYVKGGYVSDQLDAGWIYNTKRKWVTEGGKRKQITVVSEQLKMEDFGPHVHEVRDYDVVFEDDEPAISSYLYFSNESQVHQISYRHSAFNSTFRLANKSRRDAVLNGEDTYTFGTDNAIQQRMLVYGTTLKIDDERSITVSDKTSINSRGVDELTIDVDWIQSESSANKLGSHIVEALTHPVSTYDINVFGNAAIRVGQIVSIYNPQQGVGDIDRPETMNRFFVYGVNQSNSGAQSTGLKVREVIGSGGMRNITLTDVLKRNNNAMNLNPNFEDYEQVGSRIWHPKGYTFRTGVAARYVPSRSGVGGGAVKLIGTGASPYATSMLLTPFPDGVGRLSHQFGEHYLFTVNVTGNTNSAVAIVIEGWPTTGSMTKTLASKTVTLKRGENKDVTMVGQFTTDPDIPEIHLSVRALDPGNLNQGAKITQSLSVNYAYFRSSQSQDGIYPLRGGDKYRNL